jgi:hypothetical protein
MTQLRFSGENVSLISLSPHYGQPHLGTLNEPMSKPLQVLKFFSGQDSATVAIAKLRVRD